MANSWQGKGSAPLPQSGTGVGQWYGQAGASGAAFTLPSGGLWMYFISLVAAASGILIGTYASGFATGSTIVGAATAGDYWEGWAGRIA